MQGDTGSDFWTLIIAIVGAGAWIPYLITLAIKLFSKAKVSLHAKKIILSHDINGPSIRLPVAFVSENKSARINEIDIELQYEDKSEAFFKWFSISSAVENSSIDSSGNKITNTFLSDAIMIFLPKENVQLLSIVFQERNKTIKKNDILTPYVDRFERNLKRTGNKSFKEYMESIDGWYEVEDFIKDSYIWKAGEYKFKFIINSADRKINFISELYSFNLTKADEEWLNTNLEIAQSNTKEILHKSFMHGDYTENMQSYRNTTKSLTSV
ncbi:hypothetical protein [Maridesulfovibrio bastinii]|uniref:hypothetical protein n=1 Tax=Maridesulfovibrio bastinii TaxID=47157 RepID=UPI0003FD88B2|nr:hypothetical protein [Maridesulfovibrio bastinii]